LLGERPEPVRFLLRDRSPRVNVPRELLTLESVLSLQIALRD